MRPVGSSGMTLIEVLMALGIGAAIVVFAAQNVKVSYEMRKLAKSHDLITDIETKIRYAALDLISLNVTANENSDFSKCFKPDGENCPRGSHPLDLWLASGSRRFQLSGDYDGSGKKCTAGCPVKVTTAFEGPCRDSRRCDVPAALLIHYLIEVDDIPFRKGTVTYTFSAGEFSDINKGCETDAQGRGKFVSKVSFGDIECTELPGIPQQAVGVNTGACDPIKEVLVGFDGIGNPICSSAQFNN